MATKKISLYELRSLIGTIIREEIENKKELDDETLINNIENLNDKDIHGFSQYFKNMDSEMDEDDEPKVMQGILNVIKKVNPNADLEKKKQSLERAFYETCDRLYNAGRSGAIGLRNYFKNNLYMFK